MPRIKSLLLYFFIKLIYITHGLDTEILLVRVTNENTTVNPIPDPGLNGNLTGTTRAECRGIGSECCYMYTWPGYREDISDTNSNAPRVCQDLNKRSRRKEFPCFDPLVYTFANSTKNQRPNHTQVEEACDKGGHRCYCKGPMCLSYTFYNNDAGKTIVNETHFCGTLTDTSSKEQISNGCFTEVGIGFIKKICVCKGNLCNQKAPRSRLSLNLMLGLLAYILMDMTCHF